MVIETKPTDVEWKSLSPDEKLERRFQAWISPPGVQFVSPEAGAEYKARVRRFQDAIQSKKTPDRVPVMASLGAFAAAQYGYTQHDLMYDADKVVDLALRATVEFQLAVHMHKCGDGIMSDEMFKTFYWGPLRKLCMGFIKKGLIPRFSLEGRSTPVPAWRFSATCRRPKPSGGLKADRRTWRSLRKCSAM